MAIELLAPAVGYPTPLLGRSRADDYDIDGGHFAERCQGLSIAVAGAAAAHPARDAYTYIHVPIIAGIIAVAVGDNLVLAHPTERLSGVGAATVVGGPALFLLGEILFRFRMTGTVCSRRLTCVGALGLAAPISTSISAIAVVAIVTAMLTRLALSEQFIRRPKS